MAYRVPNTDTTLTSATGWDTSTNTPTLHATTNATMNATARFTGTFTAPNTTNTCRGVLLYCVTTGAGGSIVVTLQESTVDTAATVSIPAANLVAGNWYYFRFPTPYTFTTTTAGAYRFKAQNTGVTSSGTWAADSGGTNYAFIAIDNRTGAIGSSDILFVQAENGSGSRVVTMDGSVSFGVYGDTTLPVARSLGNSLYVSAGGIMQADTAASVTVSIKGNTTINPSGQFLVGSSGTPYPSSKVFTYQTDGGVTSGDHGFFIQTGGKCLVYGAARTGWKAKYVSGLGTAASPLITDGDIGSIGDEVLVAAASNNATNYNETEYRFIITKNSSTSYVLSSTSGGTETALVNTHLAGAYVLNVQRNVIFKPATGTTTFWTNDSITAGDVNMQWVRFEGHGAAAGTAGKLGIQLARTTSRVASADYCVAYATNYNGFTWTSSKATSTHTGMIGCKSAAAATVPVLALAACGNKTLIDCFAVDNQRMGIQNTGFNNMLTRCVSIANNKVGTALTTATGGAYVAGSSTWVDCEVYCNRNAGMSLVGASGSIVNIKTGQLGYNGADLNALTDTLNNITFTNGQFASPTFLNNYLNMLAGSEVRFNKLSGTTNNHTWYTPYGSARATGSGLPDTTVRTPGSLAVRIAPEDNTNGFSWSFNIPAKAHSTVIFNGRFIKNTAFGTDTAKVDLYLPSSTTPDASQTLTNTYIETLGATWDGVVLSANNTSDTDGLATIVVTGLTTTANAYIYCDDFYNAGDTITNSDKVTGLDTWDNGKPSSIISPQVLNIADIWNYPTNVLTASGTVGKNVADLALAVLLVKDKLS